MDSPMTTTLDNEDWLRSRTWDMYRVGTLITTVDDLLWALRAQSESLDQQKIVLQHFMTLPTWRVAPDDLILAVGKFLSGMSAAFNPDQPRDDNGEWTSGGGGSGDDSSAPITPTPTNDLANMTPDDLQAHMADVVERQQTALSQGLDTLHTEDMVDGIEGKYTADREVQQQKIIDGFLNKPGVESDRQLLLMAGLPGSGKTTFLTNNAQSLGIDPKKFVDANPDEVKVAMYSAGMVPDYSSLGLSSQETSTLIQEESSTITGKIVMQAAAQGKNIAVDSTMKSDSQLNRYMTAVNQMSDEPYRSTMILIDTTKEQSVERATSRYQTGGRFIPLSNIENMKLNDAGQTPSRVTFDNNSSEVDRAILVNNGDVISDSAPPTSNEPTITADGSGGNGIPPVESVLGSPSDGEEFSKNFEAAFANNPFTAFVNHYTPEEIENDGMKPLTSNDGKTGLLIHDHGDGRVEATALYNVSGIRDAGVGLLNDSVANHGVNYVECFGDVLKGMYQKVGFQVDTSSPFDPQYAPENWNYKEFGTPNYYTMKIPTT